MLLVHQALCPMHERQRTASLVLLALSLTIGCDTPKNISPKTQNQPSKERNTSAQPTSVVPDQRSNKHNTSAQPTSAVPDQRSKEQKHSVQPTKTANTSTNTEGSKAGRAGFLAKMSDAVKTLKDEHKAPEAKVNTLVNVVSQIGTSLDNKTKLLEPSEDVAAMNRLVYAAFDALYSKMPHINGASIRKNEATKAALAGMAYDKLNAAVDAIYGSKEDENAAPERRLGMKLAIYLIECAYHNEAIPATHKTLYKKARCRGKHTKEEDFPKSAQTFDHRFREFKYNNYPKALAYNLTNLIAATGPWLETKEELSP